MILRQSQKFLAALLALALLLAPIEFVYAHDGGGAQMSGEMAGHGHDMTAHDHQPSDSEDAAGQDCPGKGSCSDCVYCSPALSHLPQVTLDTPQTARLAASVPANYSIDLPVDIRPPRPL